MSISRQLVENLAPDQSSLSAATKLLKPAKWPVRQKASEGGVIWGECQGSGANPYRVIFDTGDHGYKCTCPSRKFPCKHVLTLMLFYADGPGDFAGAATPDWVTDWMGRRKRGPAAAPSSDKPAPAKNLDAAQVEPDAPAPPDPKAEARKAAAKAKQEVNTEAAIRDGLIELEQWVSDQLRTGLAGFLNEIVARCRRIAARLVDAKAGALASRVDELPARVLALPNEQQLDGAVAELSKLIVLVRAYRAVTPVPPDVRRMVATSENREEVLANPEAPRVTSTWEVVATREETRRDGLISQSTWLLNLEADQTRFALLLDFFPASVGKRGAAFSPGEQFPAELVFYPGANPLRALIVERQAMSEEAKAWPAPPPDGDVLHGFARAIGAEPWLLEAPILLPPGRVGARPDGALWWRSARGDDWLPLDNDAVSGLALGTELVSAAAIWRGHRVHLLAAQTPWGRLGFDG